MVRGTPGPALIAQAISRPVRNRARHLVTVPRLTPSRAAIATLLPPSAQPARSAPACYHPPARSGRRTSRPLPHTEGGVPEAKGPEEDRDEVLDPAVQRCSVERRCRQMGSRGVDEDPDQNVGHDEESPGAEKGLEKIHRSSPPSLRTLEWRDL